jgi:pimeloyl-ACP methyl ester carboxylesterase
MNTAPHYRRTAGWIPFGVLLHLATSLSSAALPPPETINPESFKVIRSDRSDGRFVSTRGFVHYLIQNSRPKLAFNPEFTKSEMVAWKAEVRAKLKELVRFPAVPPQPAPKLISSARRDGYTVEKWELYPQPGSVVPFLMLVPDSASAQTPAPGVLCYPGSQGSKENLAGESLLNPRFDTDHPAENRMAMFYVKEGFVAVAVDNPGIAETSDLEKFGLAPWSYDRSTFSRYLLDLGWTYMGLSAFQGEQILNWMRTRPFIDRRRIVLSGHSLGTEAVMVLAIIDPDIRAVVYSNFLPRTILRAKVWTKPKPNGERPQVDWLGHCVPGLWEWFDYPDLVASFAPVPLIITEGGSTRDLNLVKRAYRIMGAEEKVSVHYYPKYQDPHTRFDDVDIPEGLDQQEWFRYVNVDAPNHSFKAGIVVPWLHQVVSNTP